MVKLTKGQVWELADMPYAEAKRTLLALFDKAYTTELLRRAESQYGAARIAGLDRSNFRRLAKQAATGVSAHRARKVA